MELLTDEKIGFDENASYIVEEFMNDLAEVMGMETFRKPETHISPKYGFSGWLPGKEENGKANAIHTYVWDDREPSFWSIDISTTAENLKKKVSQIIEFTRQKLSPYEIVYKTSQAPGDWKELDESIIRQRLSFLAKMKDGFNQENVANFFSRYLRCS
ncbi:hypothetical protein HC823_02395 [Candidatus Gracilibacteria bacterium]|nr:hypothetical protein [Candidatus Gracilibacteria bacterium]